jgi:hypothetical protein
MYVLTKSRIVDNDRRLDFGLLGPLKLPGCLGEQPCGVRVQTSGLRELCDWERRTAKAMAPLDALIEFAFGAGLRAGELGALRLTDLHVDGADRSVTVRYGGALAEPTKRGKSRYVPLFGRSLDAMRRWLATLPTYAPENPHGLVFPTPSGRSEVKRMSSPGMVRPLLVTEGGVRPAPPRQHNDHRALCAPSRNGAQARGPRNGPRWSTLMRAPQSDPKPNYPGAILGN